MSKIIYFVRFLQWSSNDFGKEVGEETVFFFYTINFDPKIQPKDVTYNVIVIVFFV